MTQHGRGVVPKFRVLANWLYGVEHAETIRPTRVLSWVALTVAGTAIAFLRIPPISRNLLWAEDGRNFVADALAGHSFGAFFEPFAGYMHAIARLTSLLVLNFVPLARVPEAVTVTLIACTITAGVATLAFAMLRPRMPSLLPRLAVWVGIVSSQIAVIEANGSIANSHWYLLVGLFVVLMTRQRHAVAIAIASLVVSLTVLSDPLAGVFLPFVLVRIVAIRRFRELWVPVIFLASFTVQLSVVLGTHLSPANSTPTLVNMLRATGFRVFLAALAGESRSSALYAALGTVSLVGALVVVLACLTWAALHGKNLGGLATASVATAAVFYVFTTSIRWFPQFDSSVSTDRWRGSRYSVVPISLFFIVLSAAAGTWKGKFDSVHSDIRRCRLALSSHRHRDPGVLRYCTISSASMEHRAHTSTRGLPVVAARTQYCHPHCADQLVVQDELPDNARPSMKSS